MELHKDKTGRIHYGPLSKGGYQRSDELPVIFRMVRGEVFAYFPTLQWAPFLITSYAHVGQHGGADRGWLQMGRRAEPHEYADLLAELRGIYETGDEQDPPVTLRVYKRAVGKASVH